MGSSRTSDAAILLGHVIQCEDCRALLLEQPERVLIGRKIPEDQRQKLIDLREEDFENIAMLASTVGIELSELREGIDHPRARLRHL
ncbi:MAG: hypothetical protein U9R25_01220 [Chloroflexota bacterium]|nr:hypothetical protein [Chloroflexota bacterium]